MPEKNGLEVLMAMKDLGKYVNKWVAVVDNKVVAIGDSGKAVFKESKQKHPNKIAFIMKIPSNVAMLL